MSPVPRVSPALGSLRGRAPELVVFLERQAQVGDTLFALAIADAPEGGIGLDNRYTFRMVQEYVNDAILVSEEEIAGAMAFALEEHHLVVEGAGAVGIAALLYGRVKEIGRNVVVVISGSNVDLRLLL